MGAAEVKGGMPAKRTLDGGLPTDARTETSVGGSGRLVAAGGGTAVTLRVRNVAGTHRSRMTKGKLGWATRVADRGTSANLQWVPKRNPHTVRQSAIAVPHVMKRVDEDPHLVAHCT